MQFFLYIFAQPAKVLIDDMRTGLYEMTNYILTLNDFH